MSQQGMMMGDGVGNPGGNDAMSTSGESVNQNIPPPPPGGEDVGGSLSPQESGLPVPSNQWLVMAVDGQPVGDNVPDNRALVGPVTGPPVADSGYQPPAGALGEPLMTQAMVPVRGPDPSASMAAAVASTLTQAAMTAAQQSAIAGQQAQQATQQSAAAGQQAQQALNVGASALQQTNALRDETSQVLGQVKTGLEALHERQGAALSVAQHSDARSSEAVKWSKSCARRDWQINKALQTEWRRWRRLCKLRWRSPKIH